MRYFDKLPTISYNGYTVKNLMSRAKLDAATKSNNSAYYPYTIQEEDRIDQLSNLYYDHPGFTWLIWMANEHIDPYYDFPLNEMDFIAHIVSKYGSENVANRKIKCYRSNWYNNSEEITITQFAALNYRVKKFYDPVVDSEYAPIRYKRKKEDLLSATNKIVALTHSDTVSFIVGEEVAVGATYAFVTASSNGYTICQHVTGEFAVSAVIVGKESSGSVTLTGAGVLSESILADDVAYWVPVTYFEYEAELNEAKRHIRLIDARLRHKAESDLQRVMSE